MLVGKVIENELALDELLAQKFKEGYSKAENDYHKKHQDILIGQFEDGYKQALNDIKEKGIIFNGGTTYEQETKVILLTQDKFKEIFD